jgi:hypothetical protein
VSVADVIVWEVFNSLTFDLTKELTEGLYLSGCVLRSPTISIYTIYNTNHNSKFKPSVLLRFTDSDYSFGIFFNQYNNT